MKGKGLYLILIIFVGATGYKIVTNYNKERGLNKDASNRFIKNFDKLVGAKKMERDDPDAEINSLIAANAASETNYLKLQQGDSGKDCEVLGVQENLKDLKLSYIRLTKKCAEEECDELELARLDTLPKDIDECLRQYDLIENLEE